MKSLVFTIFLLAFTPSVVWAGIKATPVSTGLGVPWGIAQVSQHELIVTDRNARYSIVDLKTGTKKTYPFPLKVEVGGQGGLLDVVTHPNFRKNKWIYFTYSKDHARGATTALARGKWIKGKLTEVKDIYVANAHTSTSRHFGSRIAFDHNGFLFFTVGDRGERDRAQSLKNEIGKVLRLRDNGSVPKGNPFKSAIWSYGHRNPQGLYFDKKNKVLWEVEHGPRGGDEINKIKKGENYGWPIVSYGKEYFSGMQVGTGTHKKGMLQPAYQYTPSIAPCGFVIYSGKRFKQWTGSFFIGALALQHLNQIIGAQTARQYPSQKITEKRFFEDKGWRVRSLFEARDGSLYMGVDGGKLFRLTPTT